jgi:hypothetical protein
VELDQDDFIFHRDKANISATAVTDKIQLVENEKINKYNYQNSMIIEWKGK